MARRSMLLDIVYGLCCSTGLIMAVAATMLALSVLETPHAQRAGLTLLFNGLAIGVIVVSATFSFGVRRTLKEIAMLATLDAARSHSERTIHFLKEMQKKGLIHPDLRFEASNGLLEVHGAAWPEAGQEPKTTRAH